VTFRHGVARCTNLEPELWGEVFEPLKDPAFFARAAIDPALGVVTWPNGADFSPEFLYSGGRMTADAESA